MNAGQSLTNQIIDFIITNLQFQVGWLNFAMAHHAAQLLGTSLHFEHPQWLSRPTDPCNKNCHEVEIQASHMQWCSLDVAGGSEKKSR